MASDTSASSGREQHHQRHRDRDVQHALGVGGLRRMGDGQAKAVQGGENRLHDCLGCVLQSSNAPPP